MGFCFPLNLTIQEWIIWIIFAILIFIAIWNDKREGKWKKFKKEFREEKEINGKKIKDAGVDKWIYHVQKRLDYLSGGLIMRQIFNPYILFPLSILLFWILKINNTETGDIVLTLTLIAIIWYSRETFVLRQEQWRSNKIASKASWFSVMPGLTLRWTRENGGNWSLIISNQGKGTAVNVAVEVEDDNANYYEFHLNGVNAIYPGHSVGVPFYKIENEGNYKKTTPLNTEEMINLEDKPVLIKILFGSAVDANLNHYTKIKIKSPPNVDIIETKWN